MFPFANMMNLLTHKLPRLRRRSLAFGLVAAGFLACLLLDHARRPWAALALAATAAVTLALEAIWRLPSAYAGQRKEIEDENA